MKRTSKIFFSPKSIAGYTIIETMISVSLFIIFRITSSGYNIGDASCNSTNPNRLGRELKISSKVGVPP